MTITLSCLAHVKRPSTSADRPPAPPIHVDVVAVLDRSGSMAPLLPGATAGVRHFLTEQKNRRDDTYVECVTFDDIVEIPYSGVAERMLTEDIKKCTNALTARGLTRLFDTAIEAIKRQTVRLEKWRASLSPKIAALHPKAAPIFFLLTDGQNNRGIADAPAFRRVVEKFKRDWKATMIFVAANMDAMSTGQQFGFAPETCLQMDHDAVHAEAAFRSATAAVYRGASGGAPTIPQLDRQKSGTVWTNRAASVPLPPQSRGHPHLRPIPPNLPRPHAPMYAQNVPHVLPPPALGRQVTGGGRGYSHGP